MTTFKGHIKRVRQGIRSTSKSKLKDPIDDEADQFELTAGPKFNKVYVKMIDTHDLENATFTDIMEELPYTSSWGNNRHIFMLY